MPCHVKVASEAFVRAILNGKDITTVKTPKTMLLDFGNPGLKLPDFENKTVSAPSFPERTPTPVMFCVVCLHFREFWTPGGRPQRERSRNYINKSKKLQHAHKQINNYIAPTTINRRIPSKKSLSDRQHAHTQVRVRRQWLEGEASWDNCRVIHAENSRVKQREIDFSDRWVANFVRTSNTQKSTTSSKKQFITFGFVLWAKSQLASHEYLALY